MRLFFLLLFFYIIYTPLSPAYADNLNSGPRRIRSVGCHPGANHCNVIIAGDPIGAPSCMHTHLRFTSGAPGGDDVLAMLISAYHTKTEVYFFYPNDRCYEKGPSYPTFVYIQYKVLP